MSYREHIPYVLTLPSNDHEHIQTFAAKDGEWLWVHAPSANLRAIRATYGTPEVFREVTAHMSTFIQNPHELKVFVSPQQMMADPAPGQLKRLIVQLVANNWRL